MDFSQCKKLFLCLHFGFMKIMRSLRAKFVILLSMLILCVYYKQLIVKDSNIFYKGRSVIPNVTDPNDFLINRRGCAIPNYAKNWTHPKPEKINNPCAHRAIFLEPVGKDKIIFRVDTEKMKIFTKKKVKFQCCYQFGINPTVLGRKLVYTDCAPLKNGKAISQLSEVIRISCEVNAGKNKQEYIYDDVFIKMKPIKQKSIKSSKIPWNVLIFGIGSMSRARIHKTMPQTVQYLKHNRWFDYKAYHTISHHTLPNLISILTGKNMSSFNRECKNNLKCDKTSIWQQFKNANYVTAFGDEHFQLSNIFSKHGLHTLPSNHYLQSFISNAGVISNTNACTKLFSTQILDYARQFVTNYKHNRFFGMFWMSSYDNREEIKPSTIDEDLAAFLKYTDSIGLLQNTFIILVSDHGISSGQFRIPVEAYYEERLPMLFMWVPSEFKKSFYRETNSVRINQDFLTSPYDLYVTLTSILSLSGHFIEEINAESCPYCSGLFTLFSHYRKCDEVGIDEQWCTCHNMNPVVDEEKAKFCLNLAVSYIRNKVMSINTIPCTKCEELELHRVLRKHFYSYNNNNYYVIVFSMTPGDFIYEATILDDHNKLNVIQPVLSLSAHNKGNCVVNAEDQIYCLCNVTKCNKDELMSNY